MNNPKLVGCVPELEPKVDRVLAAMAERGHPMMVTEGFRTTERQHELWLQGRGAPGPIVTNCDGVLKPSNHQSGRAADLAFVIDGKPSWDARLPWKMYGAQAVANGLRWGGAWARLHDLPHVEL